MEITGCHRCKRGRGAWCVSCRRVEFDDIRIAHEPKTVHPTVDALVRSPSDKATNLPDEIEAQLRQGMMAFWDLSDEELILVKHLMRGGSLTGFWSRMERMANRVAKYKGRSAARTKMMANAIRAKSPLFRAVISGRDLVQQLAAPVGEQPDLFDGVQWREVGGRADGGGGR